MQASPLQLPTAEQLHEQLARLEGLKQTMSTRSALVWIGVEWHGRSFCRSSRTSSRRGSGCCCTWRCGQHIAWRRQIAWRLRAWRRLGARRRLDQLGAWRRQLGIKFHEAGRAALQRRRGKEEAAVPRGKWKEA